MRRREFITVLGGAAIAWPKAARAQPVAKTPRVGIVDDALIWDHFRRGLHAHGYIEGRNILLESRKGEDRPEGLATAAAELAGIPVDVIATWGTPASRAAKQATTTIPIVAIAVGDPVRVGLVTSLARPGGNITGNTILGSEVVAKRLQLLKELIPQVQRLGFLWNPDNNFQCCPGRGAKGCTAEARHVADFCRSTQRQRTRRRPNRYDARATGGVPDDQ